MQKTITILILLLAASSVSVAQLERYTGAENAYYWKNRAPYSGYWQQDVHYSIKAEVDDVTDIITGKEVLTYKNNSPDTLEYVFFHLYQNAFIEGSYLHELNKANNFIPHKGKYESEGLGIVIEKLVATRLNGKDINVELVQVIDNTVLKVLLPVPLFPNSEITFTIDFKTYYDRGGQRRRMQIFNAFGYKHYNGCQWYPKISVYDKKIGWDTYQHLGREFYGDFGDFDVELTFPNHYVLEATGILTNEKEVLPDDLRKKLDIKNFASKPMNEQPSVIIPPDGTKKVWKYYAENVHDFAFTADPTYRLGEVEYLPAGQAGNGIKCVAIAQEPHCAGWQNAAEYTAKIVKLYSEDIGMYAYPKMVVADARDGMEYPMITMDGGSDPGYRGLFCHEIAHNWFYAMVGSNETYRALLDEGFSQFLTAWSLERLEGNEIADNRKWYQPKYSEPLTQRFTTAYYTYLNAAINDDDGFINTHSDMFSGALGHGGGYSMVYRKTAVMLYNLQYILGDDLFLKAMKHYFNQWKMCHPYPEDFRNSITQVVKQDLNWFFDQWLETDKKLDYKVCNVKRSKGEVDTYIIKFKRKQRMQSPIDFTVYDNCGAKHDFYIPNTWFQKETNATTLPKWEGWDKLNKTYSAKIKMPCGVGNVQIDTSYRLGDVNLLNNSLTTPIKLQFDKWQTRGWMDWKHYVFRIRPDVWYNSYDGLKTGFHIEGDYMKINHVLNADFWLNTTIGQSDLDKEVEINKNDQASFRISYKTPVHRINKNFSVWIGGGQLDGLSSFYGGAEQLSKSEHNRLFAEYKLMYRKNTNDIDYLLYPLEWQSAKYNNTLTVGAARNYTHGKINGNTIVKITGNSIYSDYDYSKINLTNINAITTGKLDWKTRAFVQYGNGSNIPNESALFLASANPEELMESGYTRSRGFVPADWTGYDVETNHFQQGGGLNLRGYAGYIAPYNNTDGVQQYIYKGVSGASVSVEMDFERLFNIHPKAAEKWLHIDLYLFADAGTINTSPSKDNLELSPVKLDGGIGTALTIKRWGPFNEINPLTIRFDMPLFLNIPPAQENDYAMFRYVVGIGRTF